MWHLPTPPESGALSEPNAIVDLILVADGDSFKAERGYQSKLQKDLPADTTFYDSLIVEIPFQVFSKVANAQTVEMRLGNGSFNLDPKTISALREFANIVANGVDVNTLR